MLFIYLSMSSLILLFRLYGLVGDPNEWGRLDVDQLAKPLSIPALIRRQAINNI